MQIKIVDNETITAFLFDENGPLQMAVKHGENAPARILGPSDFLIPPSVSKGTTAAEWLSSWVADDEGKLPDVVALGKLKPVKKFIATAKKDKEKEFNKKNDEQNNLNEAIVNLHDAVAVLDIAVNSDMVTGAGDYDYQARQLKSLLWVLHSTLAKPAETLYEWYNNQ